MTKRFKLQSQILPKSLAHLVTRYELIKAAEDTFFECPFSRELDLTSSFSGHVCIQRIY